MLRSKSFLGLNFICLCFKVMIIYDYSEFETIEKTILTKDKIEPQQIYSFLVQSESMPCMGNNSLEIRIAGSFCHLQKRVYQNNWVNEFPSFLPVVAS